MTPSGFSSQVPNLKLVWDATSLSSYMKDPLTYYWSLCLGYRSANTSLPLVWGQLWGECTAFYRAQLLRGQSQDAALLDTIEFAIGAADSAKLSDVIAQAKKTDQKKRTLYTLVRSLIWWAEEFKDDGWKTVLIPPDRPALEYQFVVPLDMKAATGEDYLLAGYFDEIIEEDGSQFILERKHTTSTLDSDFFQKYDPCIQTSLYDLVGSYILPDNPLRGVVVEACQTVVEFSRFERHEVVRAKPQRDHFAQVLKYWIKRAEEDALNNRWEMAMNTESNKFWSAYKDLQRKPPFIWRTALEADMTRSELWNPLASRKIVL